jgi:hypothetical protein
VRGYLNVDVHVMLDVERIGTCCRISTSSQHFKINLSGSKVSNLTCKTFVGSIILITVLKSFHMLTFHHNFELSDQTHDTGWLWIISTLYY